METLYSGTNYRTRFEARWAVFFDVLEVPFQYERESIHPDGTAYPSHFKLPDQQMWVTMKGSVEDSEPVDQHRFEAEASVLSAHMDGEDVYTFYGQIPVVISSMTLDYGDPNNDSAHRVSSFPDVGEGEIGGGFDHHYEWCECPECGSLDVQFCGRAARNRCGCLPGDKGNNSGSPRLAAAYDIAKNAVATEDEILRLLPGLVYLLKAGPFYKIGKTKSFERRIGQIKLQLPYKVEKVHAIETDNETKLERYWHQRFADKRAESGEWFVLTEADVLEFKSRLVMTAPKE